MNGPESRCNLSLCSVMELHHPIMSKLWDLGGRTKRKKDAYNYKPTAFDRDLPIKFGNFCQPMLKIMTPPVFGYLITPSVYPHSDPPLPLPIIPECQEWEAKLVSYVVWRQVYGPTLYFHHHGHPSFVQPIKSLPWYSSIYLPHSVHPHIPLHTNPPILFKYQEHSNQ